MKKANHVGLMLSMIKMPHNDIKKAILDVQDQVFSEDTLRAFIQVTPTKEDSDNLKQYINCAPEIYKRLGDAEKFFLCIQDIPRLKQKMTSFLFKRTFESSSQRLKEDLELATLAIAETNKNVKFAKILELILALGNWLNYGTYAGNCFGFTLESLDKLRGTKSPTKPEITILHYLAWFITEKRPKLLDFPLELEFISKGSAEHLSSIASELTLINQEFETMNGELEALKAGGAGDGDPFIAKMDNFAKKTKVEVEKLNKDFEAMNKANSELYVNYAADKGSCVITLVDAFAKAFAACVEENKQREEALIKKSQKKKRKKIKKKKISTSSKTKALMNAPKLSEGGEELQKESGPEESESQQDVLAKLFPGDETADKKEDDGGGDDDGEKAVRKVKKVKKIKKIKKIKKKKADDEGGDGGDDDDD